MYTVVTSRFNNETRDANYAYRKKYGFSCMYCTPLELSPSIAYNTPVFVIEMNNFTNKIEGIGLIKNSPETKRYYKVHTDGNTNRYTYIGKYFIDRETIDEYNSPLVYALEEILFKGYTHSKRGAGMTRIPKQFLKLECKGDRDNVSVDIDVKKEIRDIFVYHFREKIRNNIQCKRDDCDVVSLEKNEIAVL
jgi:hypothetical protein